MEREQAEQRRLQEAADLESNAVQGEQRQLEETIQWQELRQLQELEAERPGSNKFYLQSTASPVVVSIRKDLGTRKKSW